MDELQTQVATPPRTNGGKGVNAKQKKPSLWMSAPAIAVGTAALAVLFIWGLGKFAKSFSHESTDDAFLASDVVSIAPKVSGQVVQVFVRDNQMVEARDPLVQIDTRDFDTALAQKDAALNAAFANTNLIYESYKLLGVQVNTARATADQSEAQAKADKARMDKAGADLLRAQDLIQRQTISPQEFDTAKAAAVAATNTWRASEAKAVSDRSRIDEAEAEMSAGLAGLDRAMAQAKQSEVDVSLAKLNHSYTRIVAPVSGRVTRKAVQPGDYIQVSQQLMAIVPTNFWVVANFKETQLARIRTNQPVDIAIDSVRGGRTFAGHVESIQAGSGAAFSLLPPENAVGNFVKVVQRVPVKIVFDDPVDVEHVLGPGMSAEPSIQVGQPVPQAAVIAVAILLALGIGFFWWRAANKGPTLAKE